jgi:hypothetical protein
MLGYHYPFPGQPFFVQQTIKHFPRSAHEWGTFLVLLLPRAFSDEDYQGPQVTGRWHNLDAPLAQSTALAL